MIKEYIPIEIYTSIRNTVMIPSTLIKKNNERKLLDAKSKQKQLLSEKQILKLISPEKFKLKGENYEFEIKRFDLFFDSYSREVGVNQ